MIGGRAEAKQAHPTMLKIASKNVWPSYQIRIRENKMQGKEDFVERLFSLALIELSKNGLLGKFVAEEIAKRPKLLEQIVSKVDPDKLASAMVKEMALTSGSNRTSPSYSVAITNLSVVQAQATALAKDRLANQMVKDIQEEVKLS